MSELKPNGQRARRAILWVWIVLAVYVASSISSYMRYTLLQTVMNGVEVSKDVFDATDIRECVIGILGGLACIISAVTFLMWFRRAYYNLHRSIGHRLLYSEGWATGSWFVPVLHIYRPYRIMKELYLETEGLLTNKGMEQSLATHSVGWWWVLWIISCIMDFIYLKIAITAKTINEMITSEIIYMISCIVMIPLAFITVKVIKDYSKAEALLTGEPEEV